MTKSNMTKQDNREIKHIGSVFYDEQELLKTILDIHNNSQDIELDPMYNKGMFYKKLIG